MNQRDVDWSRLVIAIICFLMLALGIWKLGEIVIWLSENIQISWGK